MSKTYTISLSTRQGYRSGNGGSSSSTLNWSTTYSSQLMGRNSTYRFATAMRNAGADMSHLYSLGSSHITSASLTITTSSSAPTYDLDMYVGALTGTSASTVQNSKAVTWSSGETSMSFDVKSCGLTSALGYGIGDNTKNALSLVCSGATLVAVTDETTYKLKYNANGGTGAPSQQTGVGVGSYSFTVSSTEPTRTDYVFLGWATSSSATTAQYHGGGTYKATGSGDTVTKTLYAVWVPARYAMTHNPGTGASGATTVVYKQYGLNSQFCTKEMTNFTKAGYDYDGWSLTDGGGKAYNFGQVYATEAPITVYAHWVQTDNIHYKVGGTLYGGQVYAKVNGTLYKGEVWSKHDGQMYKGG